MNCGVTGQLLRICIYSINASANCLEQIMGSAPGDHGVAERAGTRDGHQCSQYQQEMGTPFPAPTSAPCFVRMDPPPCGSAGVKDRPSPVTTATITRHGVPRGPILPPLTPLPGFWRRCQPSPRRGRGTAVTHFVIQTNEANGDSPQAAQCPRPATAAWETAGTAGDGGNYPASLGCDPL